MRCSSNILFSVNLLFGTRGWRREKKEGQIIHVHEKRRILTPAAAPLPESRPLAHVSSSSGVFGCMLLVLLVVRY
jgi:hypothetical protein